MRLVLKAFFQYLSSLNQPCTGKKFKSLKYHLFEILKSVILPNILIFLCILLSTYMLKALHFFMKHITILKLKILSDANNIFFLIISVTKDSAFLVIDGTYIIKYQTTFTKHNNLCFEQSVNLLSC